VVILQVAAAEEMELLTVMEVQAVQAAQAAVEQAELRVEMQQML
jgi:hypothetical protein